MHPFGIVPDEPIHQLPVELRDVGIELGTMIVGEFFLDRPVEALHMSVHLRHLRIGVIVRQVQPPQLLCKMFREFRAIVREHEEEREREYLQAILEEFFRRERGMGGGRPGERESRMDIFEGNDVSPGAVDILLDGIEGNEMAGIQNLEILRFPLLFLPFDGNDRAVVPHLLREHPETSAVCDEPADSPDRRAAERMFLAEPFQGRMDLVLAQIGMFPPDALDLRNDTLVPKAPAFLPWRFRSLVQGFDLFSACLPLLFPGIQGAFFDPESIVGRLKAMLFPKDQDPCLPVRFFGDHIPEP